MKGISYTFFTTENSKSARELINILKEAKSYVPPELEEMAAYSGGGGGGRGMHLSNQPFYYLIPVLQVAMEVVVVGAAVAEGGDMVEDMAEGSIRDTTTGMLAVEVETDGSSGPRPLQITLGSRVLSNREPRDLLIEIDGRLFLRFIFPFTILL
jgi:hypothetical protein